MNRRRTHLPARSRPAVLGALASEAVKLTTLRSNRILMVTALIMVTGSGTMLAVGLLSRLDDPRFAGQIVAAEPAQFVDSVLWAQIVVAVLAVLAVTGEYGSGQVRPSLLALPTRLPWLGAKSLVLATAGFLIGAAGAAGSLGASATLLRGSEVVYEPALAESVSLALRSGAYLAAIAAFAVGLAAVLRHAVAGLTATLAMLVVVPPILSSAPGVAALADFTPTHAGRRLISDFDTLAALAPWAGYGLLVLWAVAALAVAGALLKIRDA